MILFNLAIVLCSIVTVTFGLEENNLNEGSENSLRHASGTENNKHLEFNEEGSLETRDLRRRAGELSDNDLYGSVESSKSGDAKNDVGPIQTRSLAGIKPVSSPALENDNPKPNYLSSRPISLMLNGIPQYDDPNQNDHSAYAHYVKPTNFGFYKNPPKPEGNLEPNNIRYLLGPSSNFDDVGTQFDNFEDNMSYGNLRLPQSSNLRWPPAQNSEEYYLPVQSYMNRRRPVRRHHGSRGSRFQAFVPQFDSIQPIVEDFLQPVQKWILGVYEEPHYPEVPVNLPNDLPYHQDANRPYWS